jgi:hypothetical protein
MLFTGIAQAASRFWRRYVAAEAPDMRREGVRQQRIDDFTVCAGLAEAMRLWDEDRGVRQSGLPGFAIKLCENRPFTRPGGLSYR